MKEKEVGISGAIAMVVLLAFTVVFAARAGWMLAGALFG